MELRLKFADDAVDGKVILGIYRSNKKGIVYLDNFEVISKGKMTSEQISELSRIQREWSYLAKAATEVVGRGGHEEAKDIVTRATQISSRAKQQDASLLKEADKLYSSFGELSAKLNSLASGTEKPFGAIWSEGITRLSPDFAVPALQTHSTEHATLMEVYDALGVTIWNNKPYKITVNITLNGFEAFSRDLVVRRQVFLENWYDKEKMRTADALTKLGQDGSVWRLPLEAGEVAKLYIGYQNMTDVNGKFPISIKMATKDSNSALTEDEIKGTVEVLPASLAGTPKIEHWQCVYPNLSPSTQNPELAAKDLAAHYVTSVQFPWAPDAKFDKNGHLVSYNFNDTRQAKWMRAYAPYIDKLWIFWEGSFQNEHFKTNQDTTFKWIGDDGKWTDTFRNAYTELLRAWLDFAAQNGFGIDHWAIVPDDEPHSGEDWAHAPGPAIQRAVELYKMVRNVEPKLQIQVTLGSYALPEDVDAILPNIDVALPYYPFPKKLLRWAPSNYNPQKAYNEKIAPALMKARKENGVQVWSYAITRGIKDDLISEVLSYPVQAVAHEYTGIGYWAYNVSRGKTWDGCDGGLLDYTFVYDGLEKHPLNERYNVTGEIIVPSIRWEALRIGYQHGRMLLYLKTLNDAGRLPALYQNEVNSLLTTAGSFLREPGATNSKSYLEFADRLVQVFSQVKKDMK